MFLGGFGGGFINPMVGVIVQSRTPQHLLGRVFGTLAAIAQVAAPAGVLLGGLAIQNLGLSQSMLGIAAGLSCLLIFIALAPVFRDLNQVSDAMPVEAASAAQI
jgi:MFS family permease